MKSSLRHQISFAILACVVLIAGVRPALAVKAYPFPVTRYQPDGTAIQVRMIGDERVVFTETLDGYTIVRDTDGWWKFADPASHKKDAELKPTKLRAGKDTLPGGWRKGVRPLIDRTKLVPPVHEPDDGSIGRLFRSRKQTSSRLTGLALTPTATSVPLLVILVDFSDLKHTSGAGTPIAGEPDYQPITGQANTSATWQTLFGDRTIAGGLNHYYWEASYAQFQWGVTVAQRGAGTGTIVNDGWYTNPNTMAYWGGDRTLGPQCFTDQANSTIRTLVDWAIKEADADINFAPYDTNGNGTISDAELMIFVVHARDGQENYGSGCDGSDPQNNHIWSHKSTLAASISLDGKTIPAGHVYAIEPEFSPSLSWNGTFYDVVDKYFGVGVYAHEAFHTLGAPDIYDYGYDSVPAGAWDLMDSGSYNGARSGTHPAHMGAPIKYDIKLNGDAEAANYGWIAESDIVDVDPNQGVYALKTLGGASPFGTMHRLDMPNDVNEFFVLENRANTGYYEPWLPEHGLVIWHRDLNGSTAQDSSWPYQANVMRQGWANTPAGENSSELSAAFSLDDGQTEFTASTDPPNTRNEGTASGLLDVRCVGPENDSITYVYGSPSGANPILASSTVSGGIDGDKWLDRAETASLNVEVLNTSCASVAATNVSVSVSVASASDIPASAVTITPASISYGTIAAGASATRAFTVTLACDPAGYGDRTITFAYTINGDSFTAVSGNFVADVDKDSIFFDDAEGGITGWANTAQPVSGCASATGHGAWDWQNPTDRRHSGTRAYHTPETGGLAYTNPWEFWTSPNITVPPGATLADLSFWQAAGIPCYGKTRGRVWTSTDGGTTWVRYDAFYQDSGPLLWDKKRLDLGALSATGQIRFRFGMYTYECWGVTGNYPPCSTSNEGWYVDDIEVTVEEQDSCSPCATPPTIAGFAPDNGLVGATVVITGTNLSTTSAVKFNGVASTFTVDSATQVTATVPAGSSTGPITIDTTPGCSVTSATNFTVVVPPAISSFAPASGCPGTPVVITGTNFGGTSSVTFNNVAASSFTIDSPTQITATPAATLTTGRIRVTNAAGTGTSAIDFVRAGPPAISGFAPANGIVGTEVTISGSNFNGTTAVTFNGIAATTFVVDSSTQIRAIVPANATSGLIAVTTGCGSGSSPTFFAVGPCDALPVFAGAVTASASGCGVTLTWPAASASCGSPSYAVYRGTSAGFTPSAANRIATGLTTTSYVDTVNLTGGATYHYAIGATDSLSQREAVNASQPSVTTASTVPVTKLSQNFDAAAGWTTGGAGTTNWSIQSCDGNNKLRFGGANCTSTYAASLNQWAQSPAVSIASNALAATLTFVHRWQFENGDDGGYVEMSEDGLTFNRIAAAAYTANAPTGAIAGVCTNCAWTNEQVSYVTTTVNLFAACAGGSCAGKSLTFRYTARTDSNQHKIGWFIDDVTVTESATCVVRPAAAQSLTARASSIGSSGAVKLEWIAAPNSPVTARYSLSAFPVSPTDGLALVTGTTGSDGYGTTPHEGLTVGTTYYYSLFVESTTAPGTFSPASTVKAVPVNSTTAKKWTYHTSATALSPVAISGAIFVPGNDRRIHAMRLTAAGGDWPRTSPWNWKPLAMNAPAQGRLPVGLMNGQRVILVGSQDGYLYCLNALDGSQRWAKKHTGVEMIQGPPSAAMATSTGLGVDLIIFGTRNSSGANKIVALNAADGSFAWEFDNGGAADSTKALGIISGSPVVEAATRKIWFASRKRAGGSTYTVWGLSFDATSATATSWADAGDVDATPVIRDTALIVGTNSGHVIAYPKSGSGNTPPTWDFAAADGAIRTTLTLDFANPWLFFATNSKVWALPVTAGSYGTAQSIAVPSPSRPVLANGVLYVGASDGSVRAITGWTTGTLTANEIQIDAGAVLGNPVIDFPNRLLHVGTDRGSVFGYALP